MWWIACALAGTIDVTYVDGPSPQIVATQLHPTQKIRKPSDGAHQAQILDSDGVVLATAYFNTPGPRSIIGADGDHQSIEIPHQYGRITLPWPDNAHQIRLDNGSLFVPATGTGGGETLDVVDVSVTGTPETRLDLLFLSDGYTADQLDKFAVDVDAVVEYLRDVEPYKSYQGLIDIRRIDIPSTDSGSDHPETSGPYATTAFECGYDCAGIDRLICCDDGLVSSAVSMAGGADGVIVLINDTVYGGAGGFNYATSYTGDPVALQVAAHEIGHSLAGLWDEYSYGYESGAAGAPNCSGNADDPHWDHWIDEDHPDIGAFQECSYTNVYRPTENSCMMRTLQDDYCEVCREQVLREIYAKIPRMITATDPLEGEVDLATNPTFSATVLGPDDGVLDYQWWLDGESVGTDPNWTPTGDIAEGSILTLQVTDPTPFVRDDPNQYLADEVSWTLIGETIDTPENTDTSDTIDGPKANSKKCGCNQVSVFSVGSLLPILAWFGVRRRDSRRTSR